jgi:hypothetical protein
MVLGSKSVMRYVKMLRTKFRTLRKFCPLAPARIRLSSHIIACYGLACLLLLLAPT